MALKVLLADDSAAIKKVVQLSLQDYGAEVKSVGSGKDVLDVCRSFHPDIAFVDVLLPHKTGYEVVTEIKKDAALRATPVVMLWSAFMAFDEGKFKASGADEKLEKPFEVAGLRQLVAKLVPKLQTNPVARHLDFPKVEFDQPIGAVPPSKSPGATAAPVTAATPESAPSTEAWSMASFEDIGNFTGQMKELQSEKKKNDSAPAPELPESGQSNISGDSNWGGDDQWVRKELTSKFKVPVPTESDDENTVSFQYTDSEIVDTSFLFKPQAEGTPLTSSHDAKTEPQSLEADPLAVKPSALQPAMANQSDDAPIVFEPQTLTMGGTATEVLPSSKTQTQASSDPGARPLHSPGLTPEDMEQIRQQTRDIVERAVWKLVPEIASQIIREEIQRILGEEK